MSWLPTHPESVHSSYFISRISKCPSQRSDDQNRDAANLYLLAWIHYPKCGDELSETIFALLDEKMQEFAAPSTPGGVLRWLKRALINPPDKAFFSLAFAQTLRNRNVSNRMRTGVVELFDRIADDPDFMRREHLAWARFEAPPSRILMALQTETCRFPNGKFELKMLTCALSGLQYVCNHSGGLSARFVLRTRRKWCALHNRNIAAVFRQFKAPLISYLARLAVLSVFDPSADKSYGALFSLSTVRSKCRFPRGPQGHSDTLLPLVVSSTFQSGLREEWLTSNLDQGVAPNSGISSWSSTEQGCRHVVRHRRRAWVQGAGPECVRGLIECSRRNLAR